MEQFLSDVTYAVRSFGKKPGFAVIAVATLALGIGATAAIFSVVDAVLLRPLPYREPERLVQVCNDMRNRNVSDFPWPPADFYDLRTQSTSFDSLAALTTGRQVIVTEGGLGEPEVIRTGAATPNLFRLLGTKVVIGSDFTEADGIPLPPPPAAPAGASAVQVPRTPPPPPRTILSYEFWRRRFAANPSIVGTVVRLGDQPFEVVGVLEPRFELLFPPGLNVERVPDLWTPLRIDFAAGSRLNVFLRVLGRLKPGVSNAQAQDEVETIAATLRKQFPIKETAGLHFRIESMQEDLVADVRPSILALMGAVTFVLLIACANVANLLLIRAAARERELAVRTALGSTRWRLVQQLLAESLVLAIAASVAGIGLAWLGVRVLLALSPENLPRIQHVAINPTVVTCAVLAGLASAVLFGLVPALRASRPDVMDLLRRAGRTASLSSGGWLRSSVVTIEVALSFVLLVGSGLMIRSFVALHRTQPGFDSRGVLTFLIQNLRIPDPQARKAFIRDLHTRLDALPGVQSVTAATPLPLDGRTQNARWGPEEAFTDPTKFQQATTYFVLPGFFQAMHTRVIEGREFAESDNVPGAKVIVIDDMLAAKAFRGQPAVGKTLLARVITNEPEKFQVIGVVEHQRHDSLARAGREGMYFADGYAGYGAASRWAVRTSGDPAALAQQVREAVTVTNPRVAAIEVQPMDVFVEQARADTKFALTLIGIFAGIALLLAAVGLYSVLSTAVRQRTAEIGVRMAFGAGHGEIFRMMVAQGVRLSAIGIAAGIAAALALTGVMRTMLVGVQPTDPATFAAMAIGFFLIGIAACGLPALRAARLDPMVALRDE